LAAQPGDTAQGLPDGAVVEVVQLLVELAQSAWATSKKLEIHLVGHSAGAILHAGVIDMMMEQGLPIESCTLWAPACTVKLFRQSYMAALKKTNGIRRLNLYVLSDKAEQDDDCAKLYNKSLLYLVSHAFEDDNYRIPFAPQAGEPILGMEAWLRGHGQKDVLALFGGARHQLIIAPNEAPPETGCTFQARQHGAFDDEKHTALSTFTSITGKTFPDASRFAELSATIQFRRSSNSLCDRRMTIDAGTTIHGRR
jgi:hypothetical protein